MSNAEKNGFSSAQEGRHFKKGQANFVPLLAGGKDRESVLHEDGTKERSSVKGGWLRLSSGRIPLDGPSVGCSGIPFDSFGGVVTKKQRPPHCCSYSSVCVFQNKLRAPSPCGFRPASSLPQVLYFTASFLEWFFKEKTNQHTRRPDRLSCVSSLPTLQKNHSFRPKSGCVLLLVCSVTYLVADSFASHIREKTEALHERINKFNHFRRLIIDPFLVTFGAVASEFCFLVTLFLLLLSLL